MRERVATKVAGFFPLPGLLGFRRGTDAPPPSGRGATFASHLPMFSDQLSGGWGKAVAGAAVLAAGVSAGVGVHHVASAPPAPTRTEQSAKPPVTRAATDHHRASGRRAGGRLGRRGARPSTPPMSARAPRLRAGGRVRTRRPPPSGPRRPAAVRRSPRRVHVRLRFGLQRQRSRRAEAPGRDHGPDQGDQEDARRRRPGHHRHAQRRGPEHHRRGPRGQRRGDGHDRRHGRRAHGRRARGGRRG